MNGTLGNGTNSPTTTLVNIPLEVQTAMYSIYLILGPPTNGYVAWLIVSGAGGTIASEFFYLNLTASAIISSLACAFYFALFFTGIFIFYLAFNITVHVFFFTVPSFQCCVCVERYIAVVHPVVFLRYKALRYRVACCCAVWLTVFAFSSFFFWSVNVPIYILLGFYVVCISVVSFCCFSVLRALKQPGPGEGQRDTTSGEGNNMKRRAFNIILISLIVMVVTTVSYTAFILFELHGYYGPAAIIAYVVTVMSGLVHPLVYIYKVRKVPCLN